MQPKITQVIETTIPDDKGSAIQAVRVVFTVGAHGPFTVTIPKNQFSSVTVNQKIQEFVTQLSALQGIA